MNKIIISGRLTSEPKMGTGQTPVARFTVAVDRPKKNPDGTWGHDADFLNVVCFNGTATYAQNNIFKGYKVYVEGNVKTGSYERQDGTKVYTTDIYAEKLELISAPKGQADVNGYQNNAPQFSQGVNDPNMPFNNAPQTSGYVAPAQTPTQAQPTPNNGFYTNAPAQGEAVPFNGTPTPTPTPTPAQPTPAPAQNPYSPYNGGWQNDYASAPFG